MSMYKINEAFEKLEKALAALKVTLEKPVDPDRVTIDASIQRFEFTIELFWKLLKRVLLSKGVDVQFPKDILRKAYAGQLIHKEELWLNMLEDRNLTSHTYDEKIADKIYAHLPAYYKEMEETFLRLKTSF